MHRSFKEIVKDYKLNLFENECGRVWGFWIYMHFGRGNTPIMTGFAGWLRPVCLMSLQATWGDNLKT